MYTVGVYSYVKKGEIMKYSGKWMKVEHIILSDMTKTQKNKCCICSHIYECASQYLNVSINPVLTKTQENKND